MGVYDNNYLQLNMESADTTLITSRIKSQNLQSGKPCLLQLKIIKVQVETNMSKYENPFCLFPAIIFLLASRFFWDLRN